MKIRQLTFRRSCELNNTLGKSAIVFSPHFDDETLGCGGTIIRKRRADASVKIVFMTDGSKSHAAYIDSRELSRIRKSESIAAAEKLGLAPEDLIFLDIEERTVAEHYGEAVQKVRSILEELQPQQVYLPCLQDSHRDHRATGTAVLAALDGHAVEDVFEYPVWLWQLWPYVRLPLYTPRAALRYLGRSIIDGWLGWRIIRQFRWHTPVVGVLDQKQAALNEYVSQMTRLNGTRNWSVLGDVADGDFLRCFFQGYEVFRKHKSNNNQRG